MINFREMALKVNMRHLSIITILFVFGACQVNEPAPDPQEPAPIPELYYPVNWSGNWETENPEDLNWNTSAIPELISFLDSSDTRAFLILYNGRIAIEHYSGTQLNGQPFTRSSNWYWASAGKTLTAMAAGIASEEGSLDLNAPTSNYLGTGWTSTSANQEMAITVRNQLTMTSGLDDGVSNSDCTLPSCLEYLSNPDTRWAYHNGVYTLLHDVIGISTGSPFDEYIKTRVTDKIGVGGNWFWLGDNRVYFSSATAMARFGILHLGNGIWRGDTVVSQSTLSTLTQPSQALNPAYGYLYWLNGQSSFLLPGSQISFSGWLVPEAPADMYSAVGKNSQILSIVPSEQLVIVRMGEEPSGSLVPIQYQRALWQKINAVLMR